MKILLVEDDSLIGSAVEQALKDSGYAVNWVQDGETAISTLNTEDYALVLLDVGLPGKTGFETLDYVRSQRNSVPVIIVTARDSISDKIKGLDLGADDYLVKPFEIEELNARVRAAIRRSRGVSSSILATSIMSLNLATKEVVRDEVSHILTSREYSLLYTLMLSPGTVYSKEQLEDKVYGWNEEVASNAIEFIINGLRKKISKDAVQNIRGLGWMVKK